MSEHLTPDSEMTNEDATSQWWLAIDGKTEGRHSYTYVSILLEKKQIETTVLACKVGENQWKPISEWPEFGGPTEATTPSDKPPPLHRNRQAPHAESRDPDVDSDTTLQRPLLGVVGPLCQWVAAEANRIWKTTVGQTSRLVKLLLARWQGSAYRKQLSDAQAELGERMCQAGIGDKSLHQQVDVLDDRIVSLTTANSSTKSVEMER
ncbi:MAG: hypothetical protein IH991_02770, partial [Planctomycetes bacterium]|nr:hypothetical protein [Planctomycetota bacterium]